MDKPATQHGSDSNVEYFLLASYSCLPSVIARLERLREQNQQAVLFCLTQSLYRFLEQLSSDYPWIVVHYVAATGITQRPLRNPLNWWRVRKAVQALYKRWFAQIPDGCIVHFFNRYAALFLFYSVWRLKPNHIIHYTPNDPAGLHSESRRLRSWLQKIVFYLVYATPLMIVTAAGRETETWPALTDQTLARIVDVEHQETAALKDIETTEVFQTLAWHSNVEVLWVMGLVLDMNEVLVPEYMAVIRQCMNVLNTARTPEQQAVKFHPRAEKRETGWPSQTEVLPNYVPAEFVRLPNLQVILTISSTVVATLGAASGAKVISLVELLPFRDEATRDAHRRLVRHFGAEVELVLPASINEFAACVKDALHIDYPKTQR